MKNFAALIFLFVWVQADKILYEDDIPILEETGICNLISDVAAAGALSFEVPKTSDYDIQSYHRDEVNVWHKYTTQVGRTICRVALNQGVELNNTVVEYGEKLLEAVNAKTVNKMEVIKALNQLKNRFNIFLDLNPGTDTIEQPPLFPLIYPTPLLYVKSAAERSYEEIFMNLPAVIHENFLTHLFMLHGQFFSSWQAVWSHYDDVLSVFRNKILNAFVLETHKRIVDRIYEQGNVIYDIVGEEEWVDFEISAVEILDIYNEHHALNSE